MPSPPPLAIFAATERLINEAQERARKIARLPPNERKTGYQGEAMAIRAALLTIGVTPDEASQATEAVIREVRLHVARMTGGLA